MNLIHAQFYENYVKSVKAPIHEALKSQLSEMENFLTAIETDKLDWSYAPGKWTLREVLLHCLDVERIMMVRALMISRGEKKDLPGFDENSYVANMQVASVTKKQILSDFLLLRKSNISFFEMLPEETQSLKGSMDGHPVSVGSLWHIMVGHWQHHIHIIKERYLSADYSKPVS